MSVKLSTIMTAPLRFVVGILSQTCRNIGTAFVQLWANKGRAILTTVGIVIAVSSTITVVAFVGGFGKQMTEMVQGYGTEFMMVRPYQRSAEQRRGTRRVRMDIHDVEAVRTDCPSIRRITPFVYTPNGEITFGNEKVDDVPVRGVTEDYQTIRKFHADVGRFFGPIDVETAAAVMVMGRTVMKRLGADETIVGEHVYLNGNRTRVIGILEEKGGMMGDDQDLTIMIPYTLAIKTYPNLRESIPFLAEAVTAEATQQAAGEIRNVLRSRHGLQPGQRDDFRIERQDQAVQQFENIRNIASGMLAGIVSISLLVGGIGIMNVMLVSVTERTREIGLRKSIGGRRRDIMLQFLTEAVVLCVIGGAIGVGLGYCATYVASLHPKMIEIEVPLWAVVAALVSSAGAGVVFGIIPAFKASILHPIEALRHE